MILFFNAFSLNFAVMLAFVLLAISLGGFVASSWFKIKEDAQPALISLLFVSALLLVLTYDKFQNVLQLVYFNDHHSEILKIILSSLFLIFPLSLNSGMLFTVLGKLLHQEINSETRTTGLLTLSNTLGSALGSFVGGFILIPICGVEISFLLLALLYGFLLFFVIDMRQILSSRSTKIRFYVLTCFFILVISFFPFGRMRIYLDIPLVKFFNEDGEIRVAVKEGMSETVQYLQKNVWGIPLYHRLMTNGHSMSNTTIAGKRYMKMFVYLPVALHPHPKNAALICFGCGMTAKALTDTKELEHIEMVDISKDIINMSRVIFPDPLSNPVHDKRVNIRIEDGRFFLQTTDEKFDIITGEPPPPKYRGIVNLYTQEHFQLIHDRLAPGGIATYWLPVYMMTAQNSKSILKAFCNAFADCSLWSASGYNWMMVGINKPGTAASENDFVAQWRDPQVADELRALGFVSPEQLGSFFVADAKRINEWTRGSLPLTDNFPGRLDDEFDETVMLKDVPRYKEFMDLKAVESNFTESPDIALIWPSDFLKKTPPYFPWAQSMVFGTPRTSLEFIQLLDKYLNNSHSTDFDIYWLLASDEYAQRIITQMLEQYGQTQETMLSPLQGMLIQAIAHNQHMAVRELLELCRHLAVRAVITRDFSLAEKYYGILSALSDKANGKEFNYLRLFLLFKSNEIQRADEMAQQLRLHASTEELNDLAAYGQWLNTAFHQ